MKIALATTAPTTPATPGPMPWNPRAAPRFDQGSTAPISPYAHETVRYPDEREAVGQEICKSQMNQDMIAQMAVEVAAARPLVYCAAWHTDQGQLGNTLETKANR